MGLFKKIFKGIGKVFKKIGKAIKRAFKKVGKWFGKLGIFGQIALSFIPGLGPMLGGLFKGLGQGALKLVTKGLQAKGFFGKIAKGASWMIDTARKVVSGVKAGFKTVTSGATSFISNTTKWLGSKIPGVNKLFTQAPKSFFGPGDSVLGRVGAEVSNNFDAFKDAVGGLLEGPRGRLGLIEDQLSTTKIAGVEVDYRSTTGGMNLEGDALATDPKTMKLMQEAQFNKLNEINEAIYKTYGSEAGGRFTTLIDSSVNRFRQIDSVNPFRDTLKFVADEADYITDLIRGPQEQFQAWNDVMSGLKTSVDPSKSVLDANIGSSLKEASSLLKKPETFTGKVLQAGKDQAAALPGQLLTTGITQAAFASDPVMPEAPIRRALDIYTPRTQFTLPEQAPYGLMDASYADTGTENYYNTITNLMYPDGIQGGMYGAFTPPAYNYGFQRV
jgi:hypothetical protein